MSDAYAHQDDSTDDMAQDDGRYAGVDMRWLPIGVPCPQVATARALLAAVLVGDPPFDARLSVAEAINDLSKAWPPLPPLDYPEVGVGVVPGVTAAVAALGTAVQTAPTAGEALRAGLAARLLRALLERMATGTDLGLPRVG